MASIRKVRIEEFIKRSSERYSNKYDYSKVVFNNIKEKIRIICPTHGTFLQVASNHLYGGGCKLCGIENRSYDRAIDKDIIPHMAAK